MKSDRTPWMPSGKSRTSGIPHSVRWSAICGSLVCWSFWLHAEDLHERGNVTQVVKEVVGEPSPAEKPMVLSTGAAGDPQKSLMESESQTPPISPQVIEEIRGHIDALNQALQESGAPGYCPKYIYVIAPEAQRMHILLAENFQMACTLPVATGIRGVGFGRSQTPPGFYTMGGVRIARNASADIQTGSNLAGISGVFAELHYPPDHPSVADRGRIPINVVMHSYNPKASDMLRKRYEGKLVGKVPCTMGCPVFSPEDAPVVAPYLEQSAGEFDPASKPGPALRELLRTGQVVEYARKQLGDVIYVINPTKPGIAHVQ